MPQPSEREREWARVHDELRDSPGVEVLRDARGSLVAEEIPDDSPVDPSLFECSPRFRRIGCQWQTVEPYGFVTGEFHLIPLAEALRQPPHHYVSTLDDSDEAEAEEHIGRQLCPVDCAPHTGGGTLTAIRLQPGVRDPEIWYEDHTLGLWKMDLDYREYMNLLPLTKGAFDWQHLFTRAPLDDWEFEGTSARIRRMLDTLVKLFGDHDYTPLLERAEDRL